jgi:hypothetical protein
MPDPLREGDLVTVWFGGGPHIRRVGTVQGHTFSYGLPNGTDYGSLAVRAEGIAWIRGEHQDDEPLRAMQAAQALCGWRDSLSGAGALDG